jgi:hypothetical protein
MHLDQIFMAKQFWQLGANRDETWIRRITGLKVKC